MGSRGLEEGFNGGNKTLGPIKGLVCGNYVFKNNFAAFIILSLTQSQVIFNDCHAEYCRLEKFNTGSRRV